MSPIPDENPSGREVAVQRAVLQGMNDIKPLQEGLTGKSPGIWLAICRKIMEIP